MTESQLERQLRDWYRAEVPDTQTAPIRLRSRLSEVVANAPTTEPEASVLVRLRGILGNRTLRFAVAAAAVVAAAVIGIAVLSQRAPNVGITPLPVLPSFTTRPTSSPSTGPTSSPLAGRSPGTWTLGIPMNGARTEHTSTLLADGRVLVTGGLGPHGTFASTGLASAEIYDPASRTWSKAADMSTSRVGHTATLLVDGRVLVAGGSSGDPWHPDRAGQTAEVYDPQTDTWTPTGSMAVPRNHHHALLLPDGRVLVAGGEETVDLVPAAEIWDPRDNSWSSTGNVPAGVLDRIPVLLADGRVLIAGDYDGTGNGLPYSQIYDPRFDQWHDTELMTRVLWGHTLTVLNDGMVLVAGGQEPASGKPCCGHQVVDTAELYDPVTGTWNLTGSLSLPRLDHQAVLLKDGAVLVIGGATVPDGGEQYGEIYVPAVGTWTRTGTVITPRRGFAVTVLLDGSVLVTGGSPAADAEGWALNSTEIFDPSAQ